MPKFNFRLQKVLDVKKYKEEEKKQELAKLLLEYKKEEEFLFYLRDNQTKYQNELKEKQQGDMDIFELIFYYTYLYKLSYDIKNQQDILQKLEIKISDKREEVISASRERKVFEKLKDKKFSQWKQEQDLQEQKFLDEIGIIKHRNN